MVEGEPSSRATSSRLVTPGLICASWVGSSAWPWVLTMGVQAAIASIAAATAARLASLPDGWFMGLVPMRVTTA